MKRKLLILTLLAFPVTGRTATPLGTASNPPVVQTAAASFTIQTGVTTTFNSGSITTFASGSTVNFTGATVNGLGSAASDTAFASSWNGVTTIPPTKNAIYDYVHLFDTDDDGKVNVLDLAAGIPKTDASGVLSLAVAGTDFVSPSGTLALGGFGSITGTLGYANGGTNATTQAAAKTNLGGAKIATTWGAGPTPDYAGQVVTSLDSGFGVSPNGTTYGGLVLLNSILYYKELNKGGDVGNITSGRIIGIGTDGVGAHRLILSGTTFVDTTLQLQNTTTNGPGGSHGYSAASFYSPNDTFGTGVAREFSFGFVSDEAPADYGGGAFLETNAPTITNPAPNIAILQYQDNGSGGVNHRRILMDGTNKLVNIYGWSNTLASGTIGVQVNSTGKVGIGGAASSNAFLNLNGGTPNTDYGSGGITVANFKGGATDNLNYTPVMIDAPTGSLPILDYLINGVRKFELQMPTSSSFALYEQGGGNVWSYSGGTTNFPGAVTIGTPLAVSSGGTGITALGTGVGTALGVNVGSAGAFVVNGGVLGTPSSGTVTNLTGTASININGTVGATTPAAGTFTSETFSLSNKSVTALATPSALSATQWTGFASTVSGAAIMGYGTTNDVSLMNRAGTVVLGVGPNTTVVNIPGVISTGNGSAPLPSINLGDVQTGWYRAAAQQWGFATSAINSLRLDDNYGLVFRSDYGMAFASSTSYATPDVYLFRSAANTMQVNAIIKANNVIRMKGYTVATLPAGTQGDTAFVTDALAPSFLTTIVGGGSAVAPVFYNGTNWVGY